MERAIIIRYCEIHLKGKNRSYFERMLVKNIEHSLKSIDHVFLPMHSRYVVENYDPFDEELIIEKLKKVAGIHTMSIALVAKNDPLEIENAVLDLCAEKSGTFKVEVNRADKKFPIRSMDFAPILGGKILDKYHKSLSVKVKNPDFIVNVDIREDGKTFIYNDVIKGISGMPVGSAGNGLLLLSGGIDSPVAGYLMAKRGMKINALHFHSFPYTGEAAKEKVVELSEKIAEYNVGINLYIVSVTKIQEAIHEKCPEEYMITILRRFMMRIAERIAKKNKDQCIITGESLGQVASQTIESLTSSNSVVTMPILRPLIAFDKLDIIAVSKQIDTYDTSILPYEDCCTVFLPTFPLIRPNLEKVKQVESALDVEGLIEEALQNVELITH